IQTHGGIGFTWDMDCHLYYRRSKQLALVLGGAPWGKNRGVEFFEMRDIALRRRILVLTIQHERLLSELRRVHSCPLMRNPRDVRGPCCAAGSTWRLCNAARRGRPRRRTPALQVSPGRSASAASNARLSSR